jgi:hypothetical protein
MRAGTGKHRAEPVKDEWRQIPNEGVARVLAGICSLKYSVLRWIAAIWINNACIGVSF